VSTPAPEVRKPGQNDSAPLTESEQQQVQRLLSDPLSFPYEFKQWLVAYLETTDLTLPQTAVMGLPVALIQSSTGPAGPAGPAGPPGQSFIYTQSTLASVWTINHNLGVYPAVNVVDSGGTEVIPDVLYNSANTVTLTFGTPTSGRAFLN